MVDAKMTAPVIDLETTYRPDKAVKVLNMHHTGTPEVIEFSGEVFDNRRSVDALMAQLAKTKKTAERLQKVMEKIWSEVRGGVPMTMPTVQHIRALQRIHGVAQAALYTNPPTPVYPKSEES